MKILAIQLRRIGDILLTTPAIAHLKRVFPKGKIDFLCEPMGEQILRNNPAINQLFLYDKKKSLKEVLAVRARGYDAVIDFMGNPRTAVLTAFSRARWKVGYPHRARSIFYNFRLPVMDKPEYVPKRKIRLAQVWCKEVRQPEPEMTSSDYRPKLTLTQEEKDKANNWIRKEKLEKTPFAVLVPVHRHPIRQWPPEGFREVALSLVRQKKMKVYLSWGPSEKKQVEAIQKGHENEIHLLPDLNLRDAAAVFEKAKFVLTNDSGAMHLAVAVGTPTVTIYGPTRPIDWNPSLSEAVQPHQDIPLTAADVACLGCHLGRCPVGHLCMTHMKEEDILRACDKILQKGGSYDGKK